MFPVGIGMRIDASLMFSLFLVHGQNSDNIYQLILIHTH